MFKYSTCAVWHKWARPAKWVKSAEQWLSSSRWQVAGTGVREKSSVSPTVHCPLKNWPPPAAHCPICQLFLASFLKLLSQSFQDLCLWRFRDSYQSWQNNDPIQLVDLKLDRERESVCRDWLQPGGNLIHLDLSCDLGSQSQILQLTWRSGLGS